MPPSSNGAVSYVTHRHFNTMLVTLLSTVIAGLVALLLYVGDVTKSVNEKADQIMRRYQEEIARSIDRTMLASVEGLRNDLGQMRTQLENNIDSNKRLMMVALDNNLKRVAAMEKGIQRQLTELRTANMTLGQNLVKLAARDVDQEAVAVMAMEALRQFTMPEKPRDPNWRKAYAEKLRRDGGM